MNRFRQALFRWVQPFMAITVGLLVGAVAIWLVGSPVGDTYLQMWDGAFGNFFFATGTFARMIPIALVALGVSVAFKAGFFNLGSEGQMVFGALACALASLFFPGPGWLKLVAGLLAGMVAAGGFALLPGWFELRFGAPLVISTLLLNYIADLFGSYLSGGPFMDHSGSGALSQTPMIEPAARLPKLFVNTDLHAGIFFVLAAMIALWVLFRFTALGYELRMFGSNPQMAVYAGVSRVKMVMVSMASSGVLAGLAGAVMVSGYQYRFIDNSLTDPQYAWVGLMAALLADCHPIGAVVASLFFAGLQTGGQGIELNTNVPMQVTSIIQYVIILIISAKFSYGTIRRRNARKKGEPNGALA